ncbi:738_t:CDS:2, partial [Dentiscutata heterogama]
GLQSPYREKVVGAHPETYENAKKLAAKIKKYDQDREYISKSLTKILIEKTNKVNKEKVNKFSTMKEVIKVCCVENQYSLNIKRFLLANLTLNRGNISQNKSRQLTSNLDSQTNGLDIRSADLRLFEVTEKTMPKKDEYLIIHVNENKILFDIRNLNKRWQINTNEATHTSKKRKEVRRVEALEMEDVKYLGDIVNKGSNVDNLKIRKI